MATIGTFTGTIDGPYLMRQYLGLNGWNTIDVLNGAAIPALSPQSTDTSGTIQQLKLLPVYNQASGTAANTDIFVNRTETAVGSGAQLLIDLQVGGTSKYKVDNSGNVTQAGTVTGSKRPVFVGGAKVLAASDSGAICVWGAAAGYLYTLPAPAAGLWFDFFAAATCTSVGFKVITKVITTDFIIGSVFSGLNNTTPAANPGPKFFAADGTANAVSINMYGLTSDTTSGGVIGSHFRLACINATQWAIQDCGIIATGTIVTPVANA